MFHRAALRGMLWFGYSAIAAAQQCPAALSDSNSFDIKNSDSKALVATKRPIFAQKCTIKTHGSLDPMPSNMF